MALKDYLPKLKTIETNLAAITKDLSTKKDPDAFDSFILSTLTSALSQTREVIISIYEKGENGKDVTPSKNGNKEVKT